MKFKLERYYLFAFIYIPLITFFGILEKFIEPKYTVYCFLDSYIPFVPFFSLFYFIWFIYMFVTTAYFMFYSKRDFIRLTMFMAIGMAASYIVYIVFPNQQLLRPTDTGSGLFGMLVAWLYSFDSPTNVCPSIHVINTLGVHLCILCSEPFSGNKRIRDISFVTAALIILSTMLIKQHSIIDVTWGVVFAVVINFIINFAERKTARV